MIYKILKEKNKLFNNRTRNQHYISQVEQKLNCIDPSVDRQKRRIYQFESLNRESQEYNLSNEIGVKIEKNLSFDDLYSLEIFDDATRDNFEQFFSQLEYQIENLTNEVLTNKELDNDVLLTLFNAKLMNVIRNPYCILSTLNTYSDLCNYNPTDQKIAQYFVKINMLEVSKSILSEYCISQEQFRQWLKIIFYMVVPIKLPSGESYSFMLKVIEKIFNLENNHVSIVLATHQNQICLLSDRAHVDFSEALPGNSFAYEFNLTKNAFIHFCFMSNDLENLNQLAKVPEYILATLKKSGISKLSQASLTIDKYTNEDALFSYYNARVIYQCHKYFYAADIHFLK